MLPVFASFWTRILPGCFSGRSGPAAFSQALPGISVLAALAASIIIASAASPPGGQKNAQGYAGAEVNQPVRDKWALVVGVSKFARSDLNLKNADKDAQDFYNYLVNDAHFAADHVKLLINERATQKRILSELGGKWLPHVAGPDDLVVIFISSHGSPSEMDVQGVNYIVAHDTDPDDLYATGIDMQQLARMIKARVHCNRIVIVLDACHSGAARASAKGLARKANVDAENIALGTGQLVIASSLPDQSSWEYENRPNGVFTACLLDALRSKGSMTTLGDAFNQMKDKVQEVVMRERGMMQTPVLKSAWKGNDLIIAVNPNDPQPALPEPDEAIRDADRNITPAQGQKPSSYKTPLSQVPESPDLTGAVAKLPDRVAILPFVDGADLDVGRVDFDGLAASLEEMVRVGLSAELGSRLLSPYAVGAALGKSALGGGLWTNEVRTGMGRAFNARYIVKVNIDDASFDPAGTGNFAVYLIIASGETGEYLYTQKIRTKDIHCQGDAAAQEKYLRTTVLPAYAREIRSLILKHVTPQ